MSCKIIIQVLAVVLVVAGIFIFFHSRNIARQNHFKTNGIQTEATVTELERSYKSRRRLSGRLRLLKNYEVEVSYFTKDHEPDVKPGKKILERDDDGDLRLNLGKPSKIGSLVVTTIKVNGEHFRQLNEGDRIEVLYLPDDIENAMLKREAD
jgi:hypothetical protein